MVLRVDVVAAALDAAYGDAKPTRVVALTPQGRQLDQPLVEELAAEGELVVLSSRFEGFDERIVDHLCTDAISIGPYVLSGGELPAMVLVDAIARRLPGALAEGSGESETFSAALDGGDRVPALHAAPGVPRLGACRRSCSSGDHGRVERGAESRAPRGRRGERTRPVRLATRGRNRGRSARREARRASRRERERRAGDAAGRRPAVVAATPASATSRLPDASAPGASDDDGGRAARRAAACHRPECRSLPERGRAARRARRSSGLGARRAVDGSRARRDRLWGSACSWQARSG